mgnify:CR=1 FL=1
MPSALHRPEPVMSTEARPMDRGMSPLRAAERLAEGRMLRVTDSYHTGAEVLEQLKRVLPLPEAGSHYLTRERLAHAHREASLRLLAPIKNYRLALSHARPIGFLQELYFELDAFFLPFVQVQELFGAWKAYQEGVHLAVLGHKLHPFYGTYVPTRTSHIELFGTWLSQYGGPKGQATDVGTGSGVLALMLAKAGFERVIATDSNPNAIESVSRDLERLGGALAIQPQHADFLDVSDAKSDLIVFNPPWIRGATQSLLDRALYFEEGFFERFFERAIEGLKPDGRIVLIFSNIIELVQPELVHPIAHELDKGRFRLVQTLKRKVKPPPDASGRRRRTREKVEVWELARA